MRRKPKGQRRAALGHTEPMRTCVGTRTKAPREALLRFVRAPDGSVAFDVSSSMPHRGAWTLPSVRAIQLAFERRGFERAFDAPVIGEAATLSAAVAVILEDEVLRSLGLLRRSGALAVGRTEVLEAASRGSLSALCIAHDLSPRSRAQLTSDLGALAAPESQIVLPEMAKVGGALGRGPTGVCGLLTDGPLSERTRSHADRLAALSGWLDAVSTPAGASGHSTLGAPSDEAGASSDSPNPARPAPCEPGHRGIQAPRNRRAP